MRWRNRRRSDNVIDNRGSGRAPRGLKVGGGIGGLIVVIIVVAMGGDPSKLLGLLDGGGPQVGIPQQQVPRGASASPKDELSEFTAVVLADTEDVWNKLFREELGKRYREPKLHLFTGAVESACGSANSAVGPFYCPADETVYIDLSFFQDLKNRFKAPGDFAQAYVIAHEVGHHVQKLLGATEYVHSRKGKVSEKEYNQLSVRLELQADFYAGVWAHHAQKMKNILESGDIQEALGAANAIGDDRLQKQARGYVTPDSFTHGTSEQRARWFRRGLETGDLSQGDTFKARTL